MWKVNPKFLCDQHLLGEHLEMHMFAGSILKNISLDGYVRKGLIETNLIFSRHDELVAEMKRRYMTHKSPLISFVVRPVGHVNTEKSIAELKHRCPNCKERIEKCTAQWMA